MMHPLKISIVQTDIAWENKQENLRMLREKLHALRGTTEIVVLPEMFSTGFTMKSRELAEPVSGITVRILKELAADFQLALCGSFICSERSNYYNRAFFKGKNSIMISDIFSVWGMKRNISLPETIS